MSLLTNTQSDIFTYENSKTCRACLDTLCDNYISLFDDSLVLRYIECTSLEVSEDDVLPKQLCPKCVDLIQFFHEFRMRCADSVEIFKTYIGINSAIDLKDTSLTESLGGNDLKPEIKGEKDDSFTDNSDGAQDTLSDTHPPSAKSKPKSEKIKRSKTKDYGSSDSNTQPKYVSLLGRRVLKNCGGICDICEKVFSYKGALIRHLKTCGQNGRRVRKFNAKAEEQRILPKSDALSCGLCHDRFKGLIDIHQHLEEHKAANDLSCQICQYQGLDFADTVCHRYSHQKEGSRTRLYCYACFKRFTKLDHLEFHIRGVHLKQRPGVCKVCGKTFMNLKNWKGHMLMHAGVKIECNICNKSFAYHRSLVNHMKCHSDVKQFVCHLCGFACKLPTGLASHHFRRHSNNQPILCNHCGKKFKNKETLREHLLRATGERNYACAHCGKKYRNQNELDYHAKWHSDVKPFECQQCGKAYKSNTHLKNHMRMHSGERPYECSVCKSSFMTSSVLKKHALIHTGIKPHVCQLCNKAFIEKSNLKNHMKTHK